jgi:hypothetical protein
MSDKAYSHPSTRTDLSGKRIKHTIPQRRDEIAHRKAHGSKGWPPARAGRPNVQAEQHFERSLNRFKQWRWLATRYDKYAVTFLGGSTLHPSC